jgi:multidrug efflux pump subunit AcrB
LETSQIGSTTLTTTFGLEGNLRSKTGVGFFNYRGDMRNAIYSITNTLPSPPTIPILQQDIAYTSFLQPYQITEKNYAGIEYKLIYTYGADREKRKSELAQYENIIETKYYLSGYDKYTDGGLTK